MRHFKIIDIMISLSLFKSSSLNCFKQLSSGIDRDNIILSLPCSAADQDAGYIAMTLYDGKLTSNIDKLTNQMKVLQCHVQCHDIDCSYDQYIISCAAIAVQR